MKFILSEANGLRVKGEGFGMTFHGIYPELSEWNQREKVSGITGMGLLTKPSNVFSQPKIRGSDTAGYNSWRILEDTF